jgi:hypothetical protein
MATFARPNPRPQVSPAVARQRELHASLCPHFERCNAAYCPVARGRHLPNESTCGLLRDAVKNGPGTVSRADIPSVLAERVLEVAGRLLTTRSSLGRELRRAARHGTQRAQAERLNRPEARVTPISILVHEARRVRP